MKFTILIFICMGCSMVGLLIVLVISIATRGAW